MKRRAFAGYGIEFHKVNNSNKFGFGHEAVLNSHDVSPYSVWQARYFVTRYLWIFLMTSVANFIGIWRQMLLVDKTSLFRLSVDGDKEKKKGRVREKRERTRSGMAFPSSLKFPSCFLLFTLFFHSSPTTESLEQAKITLKGIYGSKLKIY